MTLNISSEPIFNFSITNEWLSIVKDDGRLELYNLPTIKGILNPWESNLPTETVTGIELGISQKSFSHAKKGKIVVLENCATS
jgi:hypothetical protein